MSARAVTQGAVIRAVQPGTAAPTTARALLRDGIRTLSASGLPTARPDAEWLLADLLGVDRVALYAESPGVGEAAAGRYVEALARRAAHEPLQYVLGWEEFCGLRLRVTPAVLIPRPETEMLVEWALALTPQGATVCDLGTGSGCIACGIAVARPDASIIAVDLSREALAVAAVNVSALRLGDRVALRVGDLFEPLRDRAGAVDLLVANPPYIPSGLVPALPREVSEWEPPAALDGGDDGMATSRRIIAGAPAVLREGGALVMEIGDGQAVALGAVMLAAGFQGVATRRDLNGVERFIAGRLPLRPAAH